ncbi:MAG: hypothetical protein ACRCX2_30700 [Paraclostridium sp.]
MAIGEVLSADLIKSKIYTAVNTIETMLIGVITSVDHVNLKYGVQPVLNRYDDGDKEFVESAILFECPMMSNKCGSFFIRLPYEVGDMVYVGCSKYSVDEAISDNLTKPNRMYGVQQFRQIDGVILGGILSDSEQRLSSDNTSDLLIQNRKTNDKFVILASGGIELVTKTKVIVDSPETEVSGNLTVNGNIIGKSNINIEGSGTIGTVTTKKGTTLDGHTHPYNPGSNPTTSTGAGEG